MIGAGPRTRADHFCSFPLDTHMATVPTTTRRPDTLAELLHQLGDIPLERILWQPFPGTATEKDVERLAEAANKRLCELVDGVLVEKPMGNQESNLAMRLG